MQFPLLNICPEEFQEPCGDLFFLQPSTHTEKVTHSGCFPSTFAKKYLGVSPVNTMEELLTFVIPLLTNSCFPYSINAFHVNAGV